MIILKLIKGHDPGVLPEDPFVFLITKTFPVPFCLSLFTGDGDNGRDIPELLLAGARDAGRSLGLVHPLRRFSRCVCLGLIASDIAMPFLS